MKTLKHIARLIKDTMIPSFDGCYSICTALNSLENNEDITPGEHEKFSLHLMRYRSTRKFFYSAVYGKIGEKFKPVTTPRGVYIWPPKEKKVRIKWLNSIK